MARKPPQVQYRPEPDALTRADIKDRIGTTGAWPHQKWRTPAKADP